MARVASCPQCNHELLVPDEADSEAWAKCPECRAFFQVKQAASRELSALLLVGEIPADAAEQSAATVADFPSAATWHEPLRDELATVVPEEELEFAVEDQSRDEPASTAERIDEWFRSAKAATDTTSAPADEADNSNDEIAADVDPSERALTTANIDLGFGAPDAPETSADFDLEDAAEPLQSPATWDDSQHMERLLADIEGPPADEFAPPSSRSAELNDDNAHAPSASESSPDVTPELLVARTNSRRRKRSFARTLVMTAVAGVVGLGLGYYALLWLRGPSGDLLNIAHYLPKAILPASLPSEPQQTAPTPPAKSLAEIAEAEQSDMPVAAPMESADDSAEIQASYKTTDEPAAATPPTADDRYADAANPIEAAPTEPAPLEQSPVDALSNSPPAPDAARITDAPSFTSAELSAALDAAHQAQPALMAGNLADSREVARAKGFGYSMFADLAQKAAFVEAPAGPADTQPLLQDAEQLFRQTLADPHTRGEVAQILPKWISSTSRKHGGVFFAGSVTSQERNGAVIECHMEIEGGQPVIILVPAAAADRLVESARPLGVVGWIVEHPTAQVSGYTGNAPQAIWVSKLIRLE